MLSLSDTFCGTVTLLVRLIPLLAPFGFVFDPGRDSWLFDLEIWIDTIEMPCGSRLVLAMLMVSIEDFDSLG